MKYFAMINGEQTGPLELHDLPGAGVRPDTYVWCKGMDDWRRAREVADISRYYRQHISDLIHQKNHPEDSKTPYPVESKQETEDSGMPRFDRFLQQAGNPAEYGKLPEPDYNHPPRTMLVESTLLTVFCFPLTGFVAIYYSILTRREWNRGHRKEAHEFSRRAKMWAGITFFLGIMLYALLGRQVGK